MEVYLNLFEVEVIGGHSSEFFSDFPFQKNRISTFSEANLLGNCGNLRIY